MKLDLTRPIQLWLPRFASELGSDDLQNDQTSAFSAWRGEATVWLHPGLEYDVRWKQGNRYTAVATGARHFDRIDVFHISTSGHVWHPTVDFPAGAKSIQNLLKLWVSQQTWTKIRCYNRPAHLALEVPLILDEKVVYMQDKIRFEPVPDAPPKRRRLSTSSFHFPKQPETLPQPEITSDRPIPRSDSVLKGGPRRVFGPNIAKQDPVLQRLIYVHRWPNPFTHLVSLSSGLDTQMAQFLTSYSAVPKNGDVRAALSRAHTFSRPYVSEGYTPLAYVALAECRGEREEYTLDDLCYRLGLEVDSLDALLEHPRYQELLQRDVAVTRVWGPIGLFWELVLARLRAGLPLRRCENCSQIIEGTVRRRYCTRHENFSCWKKRHAAYQRLSRLRKRRPSDS
jgi:hypothetical protein